MLVKLFSSLILTIGILLFLPFTQAATPGAPNTPSKNIIECPAKLAELFSLVSKQGLLKAKPFEVMLSNIRTWLPVVTFTSQNRQQIELFQEITKNARELRQSMSTEVRESLILRQLGKVSNFLTALEVQNKVHKAEEGYFIELTPRNANHPLEKLLLAAQEIVPAIKFRIHDHLLSFDFSNFSPIGDVVSLALGTLIPNPIFDEAAQKLYFFASYSVELLNFSLGEFLKKKVYFNEATHLGSSYLDSSGNIQPLITWVNWFFPTQGFSRELLDYLRHSSDFKRKKLPELKTKLVEVKNSLEKRFEELTKEFLNVRQIHRDLNHFIEMWDELGDTETELILNLKTNIAIGMRFRGKTHPQSSLGEIHFVDAKSPEAEQLNWFNFSFRLGDQILFVPFLNTPDLIRFRKNWTNVGTRFDKADRELARHLALEFVKAKVLPILKRSEDFSQRTHKALLYSIEKTNRLIEIIRIAEYKGVWILNSKDFHDAFHDAALELGLDPLQIMRF